MKFRVVFLIIFCAIPFYTSTKTRFVPPSLFMRFVYWMGQGSIPDIAKFLIKYSYDISVPGTYIVDYGSEAVYAGFTRGPDKIPHELAKYLCALKASYLVNDCIDCLNLDYPTVIKKNKYLDISFCFIRPFLVKSLIRLSIDLLVDAILETNEENEDDFLMDK